MFSNKCNWLLYIYLSLFIGHTSISFAQQYTEDYIYDTGYLIIHSGSDYKKALALAKEASQKINIPLNLRGYYEDKDNGGLTTDEVCGCGEEHGFIPRGRIECKDEVSIEYSNAFQGFAKDLYIVVLSCGNDLAEDPLLQKAKNFYPDAYIKTAKIYYGCMH